MMARTHQADSIKHGAGYRAHTLTKWNFKNQFTSRVVLILSRYKARTPRRRSSSSPLESSVYGSVKYTAGQSVWEILIPQAVVWGLRRLQDALTLQRAHRPQHGGGDLHVVLGVGVLRESVVVEELGVAQRAVRAEHLLPAVHLSKNVNLQPIGRRRGRSRRHLATDGAGQEPGVEGVVSPV